MRLLLCLSILSLISLFSCSTSSNIKEMDVVIIGGGTGGTAAGIQAARMGAKTLIVEPTTWLGGMLTAAGVTATDGNHQLPSGLWGEFRQRIRNYYGGPEAVSTGWVSHTLFEPAVGAGIFLEMVEAEPHLQVWLESQFVDLKMENGFWMISVQKEGREEWIRAKIVIDGTDLGDVAAKAGVDYDLGMDNRDRTGEAMAPFTSNDIIQDFTYVAILKDYGPDADKSIPPGPDYDPALFHCSCQQFCDDPNAHPCATMLDYGKLPNNKYMINWPIFGNDYYANMVEMTEANRQEVYQKGKEHTLNFIHYIQQELGFKNLGLADDEFPTEDRLALIPYHREGRRIHGLCQLTINHLLAPFDQPEPLYRTGIAVGDYPVDHHHKKNPGAPEIEFPPVPSFNVPLGCLIPKYVDRLLIADKAISVSNIANGSTRLQPVILQVGQAAGALAALSVQFNASPSEISIRDVQEALIKQDVFLMPYLDVQPDDPHFAAIQRVGVTGLLRGEGIPYKWANQTWFYPDTSLSKAIFLQDIQHFEPDFNSLIESNDKRLNVLEAITICTELADSDLQPVTQKVIAEWSDWGLRNFDLNRPISRRELTVMLDKIVDPFHQKKVNWKGIFE